MFRPLAIFAAVWLMGIVPVFAQGRDPDAGIAALLARLEKVVESSDRAGYVHLITASADSAAAASFAEQHIRDGVTRAVVRERDRAPLMGTLPGDGYELALEVFIESGSRGRVATWALGVRRIGSVGGDEWGIADQASLASLDGLHRLALRRDRGFTVRDATISAEDLTLKLQEGHAFVAETADGITALLFIGKGELTFRPTPETERGQLRLWAGSEVLTDRFESAYVRVNPFEAETRLPLGGFESYQLSENDLKRADTLFREYSTRSFVLDLGDLSRESWSLIPGSTDFLADIRTRRFRTLTYSRSGNEPEDITLFDRDRRINLAVYASQEKLQARGRFYNEDDEEDIDLVDYEIDASFTPSREWIESQARLRLRIRAFAVTSLRLRLADSLVVRKVSSDQFGRLLHLRVKGQNSILIPLPVALRRDQELTVWVDYGGRLSPQSIDREAIQVQTPETEGPAIQPEPHFLYSNRSFWYPQPGVSDYATGTLKVTVPASYASVASGTLAPGSPTLLDPDRSAGPEGRRQYVFHAGTPLRYLACVISRFRQLDTMTMRLPVNRSVGADKTSSAEGSLTLRVEANPRQLGRAREFAEKARDIVRFYSELVGDYPYPTFTLALTESNLPGGHSPAYFAVLQQTLPTTPVNWQNDPASFRGQPLFFLAHELAHQWWGQAIGWKNYHEQWLSEGFAQYFAALFIRESRGDEEFNDVLKQFRRWALERSRQGPVYLGYRLGHVKKEGRTFRALVYNKAAAVIHMLRLYVGDEAFFRALRRFYADWRFQKAGTDDLRRVFEQESGQPLERFFEQWVFGSAVPEIAYRHQVMSEPNGAVLHLAFQQVEPIFDVPVSVTLNYVDRPSETVIARLNATVHEERIPLKGTLRSVDVNRDGASLGEFVRK